MLDIVGKSNYMMEFWNSNGCINEVYAEGTSGSYHKRIWVVQWVTIVPKVTFSVDRNELKTNFNIDRDR